MFEIVMHGRIEGSRVPFVKSIRDDLGISIKEGAQLARGEYIPGDKGFVESVGMWLRRHHHAFRIVEIKRVVTDLKAIRTNPNCGRCTNLSRRDECLKNVCGPSCGWFHEAPCVSCSAACPLARSITKVRECLDKE